MRQAVFAAQGAATGQNRDTDLPACPAARRPYLIPLVKSQNAVLLRTGPACKKAGRSLSCRVQSMTSDSTYLASSLKELRAGRDMGAMRQLLDEQAS